MKTVSLHTRLLLATMVPLTVFVLIFSILIVLFRFQDLDDLQRKDAALLLDRYLLLLQSSPDNPSSWQSVMERALEEPHLRAISLVAADGTILAHAGPHLSFVPPSVARIAVAVQEQPTDHGVQYSKLVATSSGQPTWLTLELHGNHFAIARYQSIINTGITSFGLLFVLGLILTAAIRRWLDPIGRMHEQLQQLTPDNLDSRLQSRAEGDLAELEDEINKLLRRMAKSQSELRQDVDQTRADLEENYQTIEAQNIELRLSRAQAIEGNRIKSAFLANISHELRTPLNSINGFSRLLLKTPLQAKQTDFVETIQKSADNLLAIINDVLDFSKIEAGKLQLDRQPFAIEDAVYDVLNMLSPQADDKGLEQVAFIYDDVPAQVIGDALRLKQVLTNLVSNAIKFTARGDIIIRVMLEDSRPNFHLLRISVSDTGIGLSKTAKADLFQAFQQGDPSVSRQYGGTGLGLVIARNLVELMEGEMSFDETQEKGATFWFTFKVGPYDGTSGTNQDIRLRQKHIAVFEPHEKARQLLKATLQRAEAMVIMPASWDELLNHLQAADNPVQAVVLTAASLGQDSSTQIQSLRACFKGLVVVLTHGTDNQLEEADIEQHGLRLLAKPVRPRQLLTLLAQGFNTGAVWTPPALPPSRQLDLRILAVDDHPANLKLVCTLLADMGIAVTAASNGQEAINLARHQAFDLIFMDIQMPGMSGIDATRLIRANEAEGQRVPIVALTAHALADEREHMLREGMNDYLTKPLQEEQLVHIIQRWTGVLLNEPVTASSSNPPVTHSEAVDWNESLRLAAGKADLAHDMLNMLLNGLSAQRDKLQRSWEQRQLPGLLAHTHYLHGATRYCGVPRLRNAAQQLESGIKECLKDKDLHPEQPCPELSLLFQQLLQCMDELQEWQANRALQLSHREEA